MQSCDQLMIQIDPSGKGKHAGDNVANRTGIEG